MKLWPVAPFFHFFYHFWLGLLMHPPIRDKKWKKGQLVRVSFFRSDSLENPYFNKQIFENRNTHFNNMLLLIKLNFLNGIYWMEFIKRNLIKPLAYANFTKATQIYLAYAIFGTGERISPKNRKTQIAVIKKHLPYAITFIFHQKC